jgi:hypothetical protein
MRFEQRTMAEVVVQPQAGIVDEDVERLHVLDRRLNLPRVGHVLDQGRDAPISVGQGLPGTGVDPLSASPQGFLGQRSPDATIGSGHQDCAVCDFHTILRLVVLQRDRHSACPQLGAATVTSSAGRRCQYL